MSSLAQYLAENQATMAEARKNIPFTPNPGNHRCFLSNLEVDTFDDKEGKTHPAAYLSFEFVGGPHNGETHTRRYRLDHPFTAEQFLKIAIALNQGKKPSDNSETAQVVEAAINNVGLLTNWSKNKKGFSEFEILEIMPLEDLVPAAA